MRNVALKKFLKSFKYAAYGIIKAISQERNMRIHICMTVYVLTAAFITKLGVGEWLAVLLCCALVISAEAINTAIEKMCDVLHPEKGEKIGVVKDIAAGAVLVCALFSAAVGCVVFFSRESLGNAGAFIRGHTVLTIILASTLVPAIMFICGRRRDDN